MDEAVAALDEDTLSQLTPEQRVAAETVADLDAEETVCPACQTVFPTAGVTRCPECDLNFGA